MELTDTEKLIMERYSCRSYTGEPLTDGDRSKLENSLSETSSGPFGTSSRFVLIASDGTGNDELKRLGTYGFIKNPAAFIIGISGTGNGSLEDFGYAAEIIILRAASMGLGTCWLGGTFTRSRFASAAKITSEEYIPAVIAAGYPAGKKSIRERLIRAGVGSDRRKSRGELFFGSGLSAPDISENDGYGRALEMVRRAPSASNKQPWRIIKEKEKNTFHFFMERTPGYKKNGEHIGMADLQRVDMGIAMYHFETAASALALNGKWEARTVIDFSTPDSWIYLVTWTGQN